MPTPTPLPSNVPRPQHVPSTGPPALSNTSNGSSVAVKQEPSYGTHAHPNGIPQNYGNPVAQQRAAQQLHQKYGPTANLQINQLQAQAAMSNPGPQQQNPHNIQLPQQIPQQLSEQQRRQLAADRQRQMQMQNMQQSQQTQQHQQPQQPQQPQQHQQSPQVSDAQTDGAGEWEGMVAERRAATLGNPMNSYAADLTIRQQLEESSRAMEGGGLMLPLSEHPKRFPAKKQAGGSLASALGVPQVDGSGDVDGDERAVKAENGTDEDMRAVKGEEGSDEDDEDAINSDLDDPDEDVVEEVGEDSNQGQIMLCTYDKVQRVKNKWKCILKDGVLTTGGKE